MRSVHANIFCIAPILKVSQCVPTRSQNVPTHCFKYHNLQALYLRSELKVYEYMKIYVIKNFRTMRNCVSLLQLCKIIQKLLNYVKSATDTKLYGKLQVMANCAIPPSPDLNVAPDLHTQELLRQILINRQKMWFKLNV